MRPYQYCPLPERLERLDGDGELTLARLCVRRGLEARVGEVGREVDGAGGGKSGVLVRCGGKEGEVGVVDVDGETADCQHVDAEVELARGRVGGRHGVEEEGGRDVFLVTLSVRTLIFWTHRKETHLDDPFSHLRRVDLGVGTKRARSDTRLSPLVFGSTFLLLLLLRIDVKLLKDFLQHLAVRKQADPVALVGQSRLEDPPLGTRRVLALVFPKRLCQFVQVVPQQLIEFVREGEVEDESAQGRLAEGRRGVFGEVEGDGVGEVVLPDESADDSAELAMPLGRPHSAPTHPFRIT